MKETDKKQAANTEQQGRSKKPDSKTFPVKLTDQDKASYPHCPTEIPFDAVAEHEEQFMLNHGKSVEELRAEGGLSPIELYWGMNDKPINRNISPDVAPGFLRSLVDATGATNRQAPPAQQTSRAARRSDQ